MFTRNDHLYVEKDALQNYPRLIIQLINRKPNQKNMTKMPTKVQDLIRKNASFNSEDVKKLESLCYSVGRAQELINMVE